MIWIVVGKNTGHSKKEISTPALKELVKRSGCRVFGVLHILIFLKKNRDRKPYNLPKSSPLFGFLVTLKK